VTGESIQTYISKVSLTRRSINVIGSPKCNRNIFLGTEGTAILLAPEGTQEAVREMLNLIPTLANEFKSRNIILRLHPSLFISNSAEIKRKFTNFKNFQLSESLLNEDLLQSAYCIFRSSSVGIEALAFNVQPIHYSHCVNGGLNPLGLTEPWIFQSSDPDQIIEIIKSNKRLEARLLRETYNKFYTSFNLKKFLEL